MTTAERAAVPREVLSLHPPRIAVRHREPTSAATLVTAIARGPLSGADVTVVPTGRELGALVTTGAFDAVLATVHDDRDAEEVLAALPAGHTDPGIVMVWAGGTVAGLVPACGRVSASTSLDRIRDEHFPYLLAHAVERSRALRWQRQATLLSGVPVGTAPVDGERRHRPRDAGLTRLAFHDGLTGLPNRMTLMGELTAELGDHEPLTLLVLDIDRFKEVNASLGHSAADGVLLGVAGRLQGLLESSERLYRLDGDRFAMLVHGQDPALVGDLRHRTADALEEPIVVDQGPFVITVTGGAAMAYPGATADSMLRDASRALDHAKTTHRSSFEVFDERLRRSEDRRLALQDKLREALEQDVLELVYQPIVHLGTDHVAGFEALLRWTDPELGAVSPSEIIPVAEESGLILPLGRWVFERATKQLRGCWDRMGHEELYIAVNLSARQLGDPTLADFVAEVIERNGVKPHGLHLEVTESVFLDLKSAAVDLLRDMRSRGSRIAIDDFGTGYSSLSYLKHLPADVLKIDRSFVDGVADDGVDRSIVQSIIALARSLDLLVLAEGVEDEGQLDALRELGCDLGQGFHWCPGLPQDDACAWLHRYEGLEYHH